MKQSRLSRTLTTALLVFLAVVCMLPMLMVLINSFKTHQDIVRNPLAIRFSAGVANYVKAWHDGKL